MNTFFKKFRKNSAGFTLIETLVGITILLLSVTSVLSIASSNVSFSSIAQDQIIAFYLAQEGLEAVRSARDKNSIDGSDWLRRINSRCRRSDGCTADITRTPPLFTRCFGDCALLRMSAAGVYQYQSGSDTNFRRKIHVDEIVNNEETVVEVTVYWTHRSIERNFILREHIFNWQ